MSTPARRANTTLYTERQRPKPWNPAIAIPFVILLATLVSLHAFPLATIPFFFAGFIFSAAMTTRVDVTSGMIAVRFSGIRTRKIATSDITQIRIRDTPRFAAVTFGWMNSTTYNLAGRRRGVLVVGRIGDRVTFGSRNPEALAAAITAAGGPSVN